MSLPTIPPPSVPDRLEAVFQHEPKAVKRLSKCSRVLTPHLEQDPDILTAIWMYLAVDTGLEVADLCARIEEAAQFFTTEEGQETFVRISRRKHTAPQSATDISAVLAEAADHEVPPNVTFPVEYTPPVPLYGPQVGLQAFLNDVLNSGV